MEDVMRPHHKTILQRTRVPLVKDLQVVEISDYMIQERILSAEMVSILNSNIYVRPNTAIFIFCL